MPFDVSSAEVCRLGIDRRRSDRTPRVQELLQLPNGVCNIALRFRQSRHEGRQDSLELTLCRRARFLFSVPANRPLYDFQVYF